VIVVVVVLLVVPRNAVTGSARWRSRSAFHCFRRINSSFKSSPPRPPRTEDVVVVVVVVVLVLLPAAALASSCSWGRRSYHCLGAVCV
jgi:hypothetical protein